MKTEGIKYLSRSLLLVFFFLHHVYRPRLEHGERRTETAGQNAAFAIRRNCFCFCSVIYKLTLGKSFPASGCFYMPRIITVVAISCSHHEYLMKNFLAWTLIKCLIYDLRFRSVLFSFIFFLFLFNMRVPFY